MLPGPQIVSLQSLHYLTLAVVLPILLSIFANRDRLSYEGGASSIAMVMNWKAFTGASVSGMTASRVLQPGLVGLSEAAAATGGVSYGAVAAGQVDAAELARGVVRVVEGDALRGWAVAVGWVAASMIECVPFLLLSSLFPAHAILS